MNRGAVLLLAALVCAAVLAAIFSPSVQAATQPCEHEGQCIDEYECVNGVCVFPQEFGVCGNGAVDSGTEDCDGSDLQGQTCEDFGYGGGTLSCTDSCTYDTSGCVECDENSDCGSNNCDLETNTCEPEFVLAPTPCDGECTDTEYCDTSSNPDVCRACDTSCPDDAGTCEWTNQCGDAIWCCGDGSCDYQTDSCMAVAIPPPEDPCNGECAADEECTQNPITGEYYCAASEPAGDECTVDSDCTETSTWRYCSGQTAKKDTTTTTYTCDNGYCVDGNTVVTTTTTDTCAGAEDDICIGGYCRNRCYDGVDNDGDTAVDFCDTDCPAPECTSGACCNDNTCRYESSGTTCETLGCTSNCQEEVRTCTGSSAECPSSGSTTQNCGWGETCSGGGCQPATRQTACNTFAYCNNPTSGTTNYYACDGSGNCGSQFDTRSVSCTGEEDDVCKDGSCVDACYTYDVNPTDGDYDEDNNANGLIDSQEAVLAGVCELACDTSNCQDINPNYDSFACSTSTPTGTGDWTQEDSLACAGAGEDCYCVTCPAGTSWDGARCAESSCSNDADDDGDGDTDLFDPDCSGQDNPPQITTFTASDTTPYIHQDVTFTIGITDEEGVDYTVDFGDGNTDTDSSATPVSDQTTHSYTNTGTYTATLTATEITVANQQDTQSITIDVTCNPGSATGIPAPDSQSCCTDAGYHDGACYNATDGDGEVVCPDSGLIIDPSYNDPSLNVRDRDESAAYVGATNTCPAAVWVADGWCEGSAGNTTDQSRCDTDDADRSYACGDDPDEHYFAYTYYDGFSDTTGTDYEACLNSAAGCYGRDVNGNNRHYTGGTEVCTDEADDNDCNGYIPLYDNYCDGSVSGTVRLNNSDGEIVRASFADLELDVYDKWKDETAYTDTGEADIDGDYTFSDVPMGTHTITASTETLEYLDAIRETDDKLINPRTAETHDFLLQERECQADCTNALGVCDQFCLGKNGCPARNELTQGQQAMIDACAPPAASVGKEAGELVFLDRNETHRYQGLCCIAQPEWVPAPKAKIEGNMTNLIKYTRIVRYKGYPVRLVIASWN